MMTTTMVDHFTRPLQLGLVTPSKFDAAQAVLYRVGEPLRPLDLSTGLSDAMLEAITDRVLPRQGTRRRRWIAVAPMDGDADLFRPPHERLGLVIAVGLSQMMPARPSGNVHHRRPRPRPARPTHQGRPGAALSPQRSPHPTARPEADQ